MATSPLFGWEEPDDTDLVKDGAAAIRTLGNAIDTSMGDLLGGTSGQVLSKASNADMDFAWVAPTSGDITGVTAGTGITGGGTSGDVTVNFDVANYGGGQFAAGKNKIINGDFGVWQRGTSLSLSGTTGILADRWFVYGVSGDSVSQQTFTAGTAPVSGYEGTYFHRFVNGATSSSRFLYTKIEDVRTFAGQTVTLSFWAKTASGTATVTSNIGNQNFGSGGSSFNAGSSQNNSVTTTWTRFTQTATVASVSGKTIGAGSNVEAGFQWNNTSVSIDIWGVQLEAGSTATPFQTATGTIQGELAACQRYYWRNTTGQTYGNIGFGNAYGTADTVFVIPNPVQMRTAATSVDYSTLFVSDIANAGKAVTAVTLQTNGQTPLATGFVISVASGLTQYRPYYLSANNSTSAYLGVSAEL